MQRDGEPIFGEPWHAQASAMASLLVGSGVISAPQWAETLGAELRAAGLAGSPDDTETYYRAVLSALERLLDQGRAISREELERRRNDWERAYLRTPHGQPVVLE
jgi:nitrile hydratase accessory protein